MTGATYTVRLHPQGFAVVDPLGAVVALTHARFKAVAIAMELAR